jgi:acetoin utilization deacetylase AcuC-like enzyme
MVLMSGSTGPPGEWGINGDWTNAENRAKLPGMSSTPSALLAVVRSPQFLKHEAPGAHPENPERLKGIHRLFEESPALRSLPVIAPEPARLSDLQQIHSPLLVEQILSLRGESGWIDPDTFYDASSIDTAQQAAGACTKLALDIWSGKYRRGFSLVRPPGHHATPERAMGFCLLNNIAVAAAAIKAHSPKARIAIVDFDLHHGNGTQDAFYEDGDTLFVSSHRYPYYPGTGGIDEIGQGKGRGATINFPLGKRYAEGLFAGLYYEIVFPILKAFRPDMILVSAGFDGHVLDPMQGFAIGTEAYGDLAEILISAAELTSGKILFVLEGGYDPGALKDSVEITLRRLMSLPAQKFSASLKTTVEAAPPLDRFRQTFKPYFPGV